MNLKCKETIDFWNDGTGIIFVKNQVYNFVPKDNKFTRSKNFVGYIEKDAEGYKRWMTKEFKEQYFEEIKKI